MYIFISSLHNSPVNLGLDPKQIATESFSCAFITLKAHE